MTATVTIKERSAVKRLVSEVDSETSLAFRAAFAAWKKTWFEGSQHLIVQYEPDDVRILGGEQGRASEVVKHRLACHARPV